MYELPAYLVWGFLESGKSTLIKETLSQDYFNDGEKTMILTFEEGEVEYDKEMLEKTNSFVVNIENMEDFTKEFVRGCQRNYYPDRVMIEYNGMYSIDDLMDVVDETDLELYQVIVTVDASTADLYLKNMKSMFMEMFKMADLVIFNRCDDNTNMGSFRRSIKAVNPRAQVGFERADGKEMAQDELLPYDVNADVIKAENPDIVILATGAEPIVLPVEGKETMIQANDVLSGKVPILGGNAAIIGGGMVGIETAEYVLHHSRGAARAALIEMTDSIGQGMVPNNLVPTMARLRQENVQMITGARVKKIDAGTIIADTKKGEMKYPGFTHVICAVGSKAWNPLYEEIKDTYETYVIGDAKEVAQALEAVRGAYELGYRL